MSVPEPMYVKWGLSDSRACHPYLPGSDRSHRLSKMGSKQARGPGGEEWDQGLEDAGGWSPLKAC